MTTQRSHDIATGAGATIDELRRRLRARVAMAVAQRWMDHQIALQLVRRAERLRSIRALMRLVDAIARGS